MVTWRTWPIWYIPVFCYKVTLIICSSFQQNFMIVLSVLIVPNSSVLFWTHFNKDFIQGSWNHQWATWGQHNPHHFRPNSIICLPSVCLSLCTEFPLLICISVLLDLGSTLSQYDLNITWLHLPRPYTQIRSCSQFPNGHKFWEDTMPPVHIPYNSIIDLFCYCMEQNLISLETGIFLLGSECIPHSGEGVVCS